MQTEQMRRFHRWFSEYISCFYCDDPEVDEAIRLKAAHSRRVAAHMRVMGGALSLGAEDIRLAEAIGLFHDLGRFPQWRRYRTFNDFRSVDHADLGLATVRKNRLLDDLEAPLRRVAEAAVRYHNKKDIPDHLSDRQRLFTQMIRDADKLDIWYVETRHQERRGSDRPLLSRLIRGEFPATASFSSDMYDTLMRSRKPDMRQVRSKDDYVLFRLSWIFDVNFTPTARAILEQRIVEKLLDRLTPTRKVERLKHHLIGHLEQLISER